MVNLVEIPAGDVRQWVAQLIKDDKFRLLSTITGYQEGDRFFIVYHFITSDGLLNLRTSVALADARMQSISPALSGAVLYEREIQDILGVEFDGIIDGRRLILPEQWPQGVYPLRKEYKTPKEEQYK